jgi:hypothetical protein
MQHKAEAIPLVPVMLVVRLRQANDTQLEVLVPTWLSSGGNAERGS